MNSFRQWQELRAYGRERNIRIIGDVPIYVAHDSADVWSNRRFFLLDERGNPLKIAGVPPDYFSATGQLLGQSHLQLAVCSSRPDTNGGSSACVPRFASMILSASTTSADSKPIGKFPAARPPHVNGRWVKGPGRGTILCVAQGTRRSSDHC